MLLERLPTQVTVGLEDTAQSRMPTAFVFQDLHSGLWDCSSDSAVKSRLDSQHPQ